MSDFTVIVPARFGSSRLPGKPLREIAGRPMIRHVLDRALESGAQEVIVATDDERIAGACADSAADVVMTASDHPTGTDRLAEVVERRRIPPERVVVNLQGDEPLMPPELLAQVAQALSDHPGADVATLCTPITSAAEVFDPNVVKVVRDREAFALLFSRAPIPWDRQRFTDQDAAGIAQPGAGYWRHLGIYAYRAGFLAEYPRLETCALEQLEQLEQLRALWHGRRIYVAEARSLPGQGVDTEGDIARVERLLAQRS